MSQKNRPLSPHITIYKPQITSVLSITHRITGFFLSLGLIIIAIFIIFASVSNNLFNFFQEILLSNFGKLIIFMWTLSTFYHLLNGLRHLFWDLGYGFEIKNATLSGWMVISFALLFSLIAGVFLIF